MMLSRLAENIYWAGRYLERAEDTARLVKVQTELILDLPRSHSMGWTPLLAVTGSADAFDGHAEIALKESSEGTGLTSQELQIVSFLTTSPENSGSVLSSIESARFNLRSVRAMIPRSGWERVNHMHLWARQTQGEAGPRRTRTEWADEVIRKCQTITGLLDGTMSHDAAYRFLRVGQHLERADMTTRVLDVTAQALLGEVSDQPSAYLDLRWMSVLKSVSAMQMFRRSVRAGVNGSRVLNFLLTDEAFPRSVAHCLRALHADLSHLPNADAANKAVRAAEARIQAAQLDAGMETMAADQLHDFMDKLQADLGRIHQTASFGWFTPPPTDQPVGQTQTATDTVDDPQGAAVSSQSQG